MPVLAVERKTRNSNIELLRIIAILLITLNHVSSKGITGP